MVDLPAPISIDDDDADTEALLRAARRPQLIREHRPAIEDLDAGITDGLVAGTSDHPRLRLILAELASDSERARVDASLRELAGDSGDATVRHVLLDHLALLRAEKGIELARLQIHAIGVYRRLIELLHERQGSPPGLSEVRQLPAAAMPRLLAGRRAFFGDADIRDDLVATPGAVATARAALRRLTQPSGADQDWDDANGLPPLTERHLAPLREIPDAEREPAMRLAQRDQVRSLFYRTVFTEWFAADSLDIDRCGYRTVLDWLLAVEETPHLFGFMQGQTSGQKAWRLARLTDKLLQLHEIYARCGHYARHAEWRERLAGLGTRQRLAIMAKERLPALPMTNDVAVAIMLLPFANLARWVQQRVETSDFVLPPERRRS